MEHAVELGIVVWPGLGSNLTTVETVGTLHQVLLHLGFLEENPGGGNYYAVIIGSPGSLGSRRYAVVG
jgi:hypothetical protein